VAPSCCAEYAPALAKFVEVNHCTLLQSLGAEDSTSAQRLALSVRAIPRAVGADGWSMSYIDASRCPTGGHRSAF